MKAMVEYWLKCVFGLVVVVALAFLYGHIESKKVNKETSSQSIDEEQREKMHEYHLSQNRNIIDL